MYVYISISLAYTVPAANELASVRNMMQGKSFKNIDGCFTLFFPAILSAR